MPPGRRENDFPDQAIRRWRSDSCNFAPWQYQPWNLMWRTNTKEGVLEWDTLNAEMRERVHLYPVGATAKSSQNLSGKHVEIFDTPYRVRLRLIGNSWHLGVTAFLLQKYNDRLASFRQAGCDRTGSGRQSAPQQIRSAPHCPQSAGVGRGLLDALRLQQIKAKDDDDDDDGIHRIMDKIYYCGGLGAPPVRSGQDIATASTLVLEPQLDFRVGRLATFRSIDPTGCGSGWIDRLANAARSFITSYAVRRVVRLDSDRRVHESLDAVRHLNEALATEHPIRRRWPMDASLQFAAQGLKAWGVRYFQN